MIVPLLLIAAIAVILFQFRHVFMNLVTTERVKTDPQETKIIENLDIKHLCLKCGREMEAGEALIHFWRRNEGMASFEHPRMFQSYPFPLPIISTNPFHRPIRARKTYYCPKCQLFDLNPESPDT
jgi:hypothetical protein